MPTVGLDGCQEELGSPAVPDALGRALAEHLGQAPDGYVLAERYWLALAGQLRARLGMPVLVCEVEMPIAEQLARQRGASALSRWRALTCWSRSRLTRIVWRRCGSMRSGGTSRRREHPAASAAVGWAQRQDRPRSGGAGGMVAAGVAAVELQDRECAARGACGRSGVAVRVAAAQRNAIPHRLPRCGRHPVQPPRRGRHAPALVAPAGARPAGTRRRRRGLCELGRRGLDRLAMRLDGYPDVDLRPLAGSVLGKPHGFGVERVDDGWRAIATCGTFSVEVEGSGEPPPRLDLDDRH